MFDQTPIEERHAAVGVFTAIGLAGFGAVYLLLTGGFASISPRIERESSAPPVTYVQVVDARWQSPEPARVTPTSYTFDAGMPIADETSEELVGDSDGAPVRQSDVRSFEDIERDIDALYEQASFAEEVEAVASSDDEPLKEEAANVSENASPW